MWFYDTILDVVVLLLSAIEYDEQTDELEEPFIFISRGGVFN